MTEVITEVETVPGPMPVEEAEVVTKKKITHVKSKKAKEELDQDTQEAIQGIVSQMKDTYGIQTPLSMEISDTELATWKKQYGEIYRTDLNGTTFVWHKLRRREYINLMSDEEIMALDNNDLKVFLRQEKIMNLAVLYPSGEELERVMDDNAGVAGNISDEIMLASGFRPVRSQKI